MKTLTRVAFYALAFSFIPYSYSYAQNPIDLAPDMTSEDMAVEPENLEIVIEEEMLSEAQAIQDEEKDQDKPLTLEDAQQAINKLPGAKDAIKGPINTKAAAEPYDIHGRQLSYREGAKELRTSIEERRDNFAEPRAALIEKFVETRDTLYGAEAAAAQASAEEEMPAAAIEAPDETKDEAPVATYEKIELKELEIPEGTPEAEAQIVKRKVVTAENAPKFDPANLNEKQKQAEEPAKAAEETKPIPAEKPIQAKLTPIPEPETVPVIEDTKKVTEKDAEEPKKETKAEAPVEIQAKEPKEDASAPADELEMLFEEKTETKSVLDKLGGNEAMEILVPTFPAMDESKESASDDMDAPLIEEETDNPFNFDEPDAIKE